MLYMNLCVILKALSQDRKELWTPSDYPDVLKVFAVDRIQDAVGSYELHCTLDVDVGHDATLVILNTAEAGEARAQPQGQLTHRRQLTLKLFRRTMSLMTMDRSSRFS